MIELPAIVLLPIVFAALFYFLPLRAARLISLAVQLAITFISLRIFDTTVRSGQASYRIGSWLPGMGIELAVDRFGSVMLLLSALLFLALLLFDLPLDYIQKQFMILFFILQGLLMGIFISTDLFNIYVLIEVATLVVTLLILHNKDKRSVYDGLVYLMINMTAMTMYLLGLGLLYRLTGRLDLAGLKQSIDQIQNRRDLILPFALLISALSLKSAVFPLFSWLPKAHGTPGAPAVVSAVLSGLYVKSSLFVMLRFQDTFSAIRPEYFFMAIGLLTSLAGIGLALVQTDIKKLLGYSTISQIGLIIFGFAYGSDNARTGAMFHIVNHALFKSTLFLAVALIADKYQTRDLRRIKDVLRRMPFTSFAMILAMLGITGAPLFNGSVSKHLIKADLGDGFLSFSLLLINLGTVLYFLHLSGIFLPHSSINNVSLSVIRISPVRRGVLLVLSVLCLLTGLGSGVLLRILYGHELTLSVSMFFDNLTAWLLTLAMGFLIRLLLGRFMIRLQKLRLHEPGFNQISMGLAVYFLSLTTYLVIVNK